METRWDSRHYMSSSIRASMPLGALPNKRLKLAGALVLKEAVGSCSGGHGTSSTTLAPAGEAPAALTRSVRRRQTRGARHVDSPPRSGALGSDPPTLLNSPRGFG